MKRAGFLQRLCNKHGDFKVCRLAKNKNGESSGSKWRSVLECWHSDEGIKFLEQANNRQILPAELILDLEEKENLPKAKKQLRKLNWLGKTKIYETGSRGFHLHIFLKDLANRGIFSKKTGYQKMLVRNRIRRYILRKYFPFADQQKASELTTIAIENAPHWKTGKKKRLIE